MREWVEEELEKVSLGDKRLNNHLKGIVNKLSARPEASIPPSLL